MKTLSAGLKEHIGRELTTLATLIKVTRKDNVVIGLTSHDKDLVIDGITYKAEGAMSDIAAIDCYLEQENKDTDIAGVLSSNLIKEEDIKAGLYDHARIDVMLCNWRQLSDGVLHSQRGWLGEVIISAGTYKASLIPFTSYLDKRIGETYTPECRFQLGDKNCLVDCNAYKVTSTVTAVIDRKQFIDTTRLEADNYFKDALLTFTTGANAGVSVEVNRWDQIDQELSLWLPVPYEIKVGDTYEVTAGCDKRFETCKARFNNAKNYGGFPHLPGLGKILDYPQV